MCQALLQTPGIKRGVQQMSRGGAINNKHITQALAVVDARKKK